VARIIEVFNIAAGDGFKMVVPTNGKQSPLAVRHVRRQHQWFLVNNKAFGECFGTEDMKEGAAPSWKKETSLQREIAQCEI